jgi:hypothetical protein
MKTAAPMTPMKSAVPTTPGGMGMGGMGGFGGLGGLSPVSPMMNPGADMGFGNANAPPACLGSVLAKIALTEKKFSETTEYVQINK